MWSRGGCCYSHYTPMGLCAAAVCPAVVIKSICALLLLAIGNLLLSMDFPYQGGMV